MKNLHLYREVISKKSCLRNISRVIQKIIILDEPTRGIDAKARLEVYETIEKMKREGLAILFISSDVEEIVQLANRVYVMRNGQFVSHLEKEQISVEEVTRLAYGGVTE